jgi:acyl-CoA thioester hydrolase
MEKRIYYHDTDAGGVVYYGNYLKYLEESRTEYLDKKGLSVKDFHDRGLLYAVRQCSITYRSPARYGDILICEAEVTKTTAAQILFDQKIFDKKNRRLIVEAQVTLVCLSADFRPVQLPEDLKVALTNK